MFHKNAKLLVGVVAFSFAFFSLGANEAYALCATSGADPSTAAGTPETVDGTACTVDGTATPTTITFNAGGTGLLTLDGVAPTGAIANSVDGEGSIEVNGTVTTASTIGVATTGDLLALTVKDAATFNLGHNLAAVTTTVGEGASGVLNQSAGTLTATTLAIAAGGAFTQSGTGVINASTTTIATGGTLTVVNQVTGVIRGAGAGQGALIFGADYDTYDTIGSTSLASITVNDGVTLTLDRSATATTFNVGEGASGIVNHSINTLTATDLFIKSGATFNQTGAGAVTAATTIEDGGTMNVTSAFTHTGALTVGGGTSGALDLAGVTVTETGAFTMNAGATLDTTINADTANDSGRVVASGAATIAAGTTIDITVTPAALTVGQTYVIVDGAGGAGVSVPTTITDDSAKYTFTGTGGSDLTLTVGVAAGIYSDNVTSSPNAYAAGVAFDNAIAAGATGDMAVVETALDGLAATAQDTAIATTTPDMNNAIPNASFSMQSQSFVVVSSHLDARRAGLTGALSGVSSGNAAGASGSIWMKGFGNAARQDRRQGFDGYRVYTGGLAVGADTTLSETDLTFGASYSYAISNVDYSGARSGNEADINSHQGALYASYASGAFFVDAIASVAYNSYDADRQVVIGAIRRTANGDYDGLQYSGKVIGGAELNITKKWSVTPLASMQFTRLELDGYTETGAGAVNLRVDDRNYNYLQSGLGMESSYTIKTKNGSFTPSVHAKWLYDVKSARQQMTSTFTGGGSAFSTEGPAPARHAANLGAQLAYNMGESVSLVATYDAEMREQFLGHSGTVTGRYEF